MIYLPNATWILDSLFGHGIIKYKLKHIDILKNLISISYRCRRVCVEKQMRKSPTCPLVVLHTNFFGNSIYIWPLSNFTTPTDKSFENNCLILLFLRTFFYQICAYIKISYFIFATAILLSNKIWHFTFKIDQTFIRSRSTLQLKV